MLCPICRAAEMVPVGTSKLDQCQDTYLPAKRSTCPKCPGTVTDLATGEPWQIYPGKDQDKDARPSGGRNIEGFSNPSV